MSPHSKEARALYAVLMRRQERNETLTWDKETYLDIISDIDSSDIKSSLEEKAEVLFGEVEADKTIDLIDLIMKNSLVHLDFSNVEGWDEIIFSTRDALDVCYHEARANPRFGVAIFIDEVHNFAPQVPHEAPASKEAYDAMLPVMKLLATTGPRNKVPLLVATQRLSEVDKVVSTQMGQNIFAFRVEDIDLDRLKGIMGEVAETARMLPRGHAIFKGHAIKVRTPVISVIERVLDPASVRKDILSAWRE